MVCFDILRLLLLLLSPSDSPLDSADFSVAPFSAVLSLPLSSALHILFVFYSSSSSYGAVSPGAIAHVPSLPQHSGRLRHARVAHYALKSG